MRDEARAAEQDAAEAASTCGARGSAGPVSRQSRQSWQSWHCCMREHSLHICKMLGICCARLPRQASGTAATARGGGWSHARQQGRGA